MVLRDLDAAGDELLMTKFPLASALSGAVNQRVDYGHHNLRAPMTASGVGAPFLSTIVP